MDIVNNKSKASYTEDFIVPVGERITETDLITPAMQKSLDIESLSSYVSSKFELAKDGRNTTESKWKECALAYRGEYTAEELDRIARAEARNPGASRVYIKVSKTKVQAAYGQILEILLGGDKFPITVEPTPVPEGSPESVYIEKNPKTSSASSPSPAPKDIYGYNGDGREVPAGETSSSLFSKITQNFQRLLPKDATLKVGVNPDPQGVTLHPAEESAQHMQKVMYDQLTEADVRRHLAKTALESCVYGTGILKGPFNYYCTVDKWVQDPATKKIDYTPYVKLVPWFSNVSCWNFFPDPEAPTLFDAEYVVERHLLSRTQVRDLAKSPKFDKEQIIELLRTSPAGRSREDWEDTLKDNSQVPEQERYEVLEYWGTVDRDLADRLGLFDDLTDKELKFYDNEIVDVVSVNVWTSGEFVLRAVLNPFTPNRTPYFAVPYEESLHQIWGVGVCENMRDAQMLMNGHMRMAIDNLRLAGNVMLEVNEAQLVPGQDMTVFPGKIWRKNGGAPGQTIFGFTIPNTYQSHAMAFDKARQLADEAVGLPSFSHGQTGVTGVGRTATGISMLMGAAAGAIKTVISNYDRFLLEPLGQSLFQWNMQFNQENSDIRGDLKIAASGTRSLMQKEVLTQRLTSYLQVMISNPATLPFCNVEYISKQLATSLGLDPEKAVNDPVKAKMYAELLGKLNNVQQGNSQEAYPPSGGGEGAQGPISGANPADTSGGGGGNVGIGTAPTPGEAGFTGTTQ